jgi:hypothetical protein
MTIKRTKPLMNFVSADITMVECNRASAISIITGIYGLTSMVVFF